MTVPINSLVIAGDPTWFSVPARLIRDEPGLAPAVMVGENRSWARTSICRGEEDFSDCHQEKCHGTPFFRYS